MEAFTCAYRTRKRPLNRRPCSKVKRRLFPTDVNRPAAKVHQGSLKWRQLLIVHTAFLAFTAAVVAAYYLCCEEEGCNEKYLAPIIESLRSLASEIRASAAVWAPIQVQDESDSGLQVM